MIADPVLLTQQLVRCPSVTPVEAGTLGIVADFLAARGFFIERLDSGGVGNLYARLGKTSPHLCFVGHTDVVPSGDRAQWSVDPFAAEIRDGKLYGRGVSDMKGAIGAYLTALDGFLQENPSPKGSLSVLLTTDEEGPALHGVRYVVERFKARGESIDLCLGGEPTNVAHVGDTIKIGRRGSLNATITVQGKSGHVAYPYLAQNPIPPLLAYLQDLLSVPLDQGMLSFDPSHLEVTSIDVGNPTTNVIPAQASACLNIRFNPCHTGASLTQYLQDKAAQMEVPYTLDVRVSGEPFYCENEALQQSVYQAVQTVTGLAPAFSTSGGTSDARFMKDLCPVIEFGLINATAHQVDEHVAVEEIYRLVSVYRQTIVKSLLLGR